MEKEKQGKKLDISPRAVQILKHALTVSLKYAEEDHSYLSFTKEEAEKVGVYKILDTLDEFQSIGKRPVVEIVEKE